MRENNRMVGIDDMIGNAWQIRTKRINLRKKSNILKTKKRRVDTLSVNRELCKVKESHRECIEDGLGVAYRGENLGYDGSARYSVGLLLQLKRMIS